MEFQFDYENHSLSRHTLRFIALSGFHEGSKESISYLTQNNANYHALSAEYDRLILEIGGENKLRDLESLFSATLPVLEQRSFGLFDEIPIQIFLSFQAMICWPDFRDHASAVSCAIVWPSLYFGSLTFWPFIALCFVINSLIFWQIGKAIWWKALLASILSAFLVNFISANLLLPIGGYWLALFAGICQLLPTCILAILCHSLMVSVSVWMCNLSNWNTRFIVSVLIANTAVIMTIYVWLTCFEKYQ